MKGDQFILHRNAMADLDADHPFEREHLAGSRNADLGDEFANLRLPADKLNSGLRANGRRAGQNQNRSCRV